jgi:hypothetical protein
MALRPPVRLRRIAVVLAALGLLSACARSSSAPSATRVPRATTTSTTAPVTTTTVTTEGGFIASPDCPYYPVMADGSTSIQDGGTEIYYRVRATPGDVVGYCAGRLTALGWDVLDPSGTPFAGGTSLTARMDGAYARINVGVSPNSPSVAVCTWPGKPADFSCPFED